MKRGLIFPREMMQNPFTAQGLPAIYKELAPNLMALFDFDERTGLYTRNKSGVLIEGLLTPDVSGDNTSEQDMWDNGRPGGVNFDGVNDMIFSDEANWKTWLDNGKPHTMRIWSIIDDYSNGGEFYGTHWRTGTASSSNESVSLNINGTYGLEWIIYGGTGSRKYIDANPYWFPTAGVMYCITVTYDGTQSSSGVNLYIDGTALTRSVRLWETGTDDIWDNCTGFAIGAKWGTGGYQSYTNAPIGTLGGTIFCVQGYDIDITAAQELKLYNFEKQFLR